MIGYEKSSINYGVKLLMNNGLLPLFLSGLGSFLRVSNLKGASGKLLTRNTLVDGREHAYQVYVPSKYSEEANAPVIVFRHGITQRGDQGLVATRGIAARIVPYYLDRIGSIILLPQCLPGMYWSTPAMDKMVMRQVAETQAEFKTDPKRTYLTGVSMGGYGVWSLASQHPGVFGALVSVCGGSSNKSEDRYAKIAEMIGKTPVWIFHGENDSVVPVEESRQLATALRLNNGNFRYDEYPGVGHNVWVNVIKEKRLVPWILEQRLPSTRQSAER